MADKSVSIDLIIKSSEAASSLKEVKQSLKDIKDEMIKAGEGTPAFNKLAAAAGQLKDKVDDANEAIKATNPNKFQALASFASSAASGVAAVTGAMGLFGAESENVTKTLAKVQSAMALSQGLAALSELPKAWNNLKAAMSSTALVQKIVTAGQWLWNAAMMANPIGAIVIAVAALVAGLYLLAKAFSSSNAEQEMQIKLTKELNAANAEGAKNAAVERNNLDNLYKAATDQTKSLKERKEAQIELQKTYPLTFQNFTDEDFALGKATIKYKELSKSILEASMMKAKQGLLDKEAMAFAEGEQERLSEIAKTEKELSRLKALASKESLGGVATLAAAHWSWMLDGLVETNKKEEDLFKSKNDRILGEIAKNEIGGELSKQEKEASAKKIKDDETAAKKVLDDQAKGAAAYKARKEEKEKLDKEEKENKAKIDEEYRLSNLTAEEKSFNDFYELQKKYYDNKNITKEEFEKRLAERQEEIDNNKLEAAIIAELKETLASIDNAQFEADEKARIEAEGIEKSKVARQAETAAKLSQAQEVVNKLQRISDLAFSVKFAYMKKGAKDEESVLRAQFKINKALQLSTAIISGISATINAFNNGMKNPVPLLGPATATIYAIGAAIMSAGQIAKIAATQFDTSSVSGGGGGGGGMNTPELNTGAATATSNSQPSTLLNPDGTVANQNTPTPAPIQVYVVESDITSTQTQVAVVQNQMNFQ